MQDVKSQARYSRLCVELGGREGSSRSRAVESSPENSEADT
jgi:hypothetical protein